MYFLFILLLLISPDVWASTSVFQQGASSYTGGKAASINSLSQNEHQTDLLYVRAGTEYMAVLDFDVSGAAIPSDATIDSATLTVTAYSTDDTGTINVGRITDPSSTGSLTEAGVETDTFNHYSTWRYKNEDTTTRWQTGGSNLNITDVLGSTVDSWSPSLLFTGTHDFTVTSAVSTVISSGGTHVSLYLRGGASSNMRIRGNYYATTSDRPKLTINWTGGSGGGGGSPSTINNIVNQARINGSWLSK